LTFTTQADSVDAIGSVQFHPFKPLIMVSAGSRAVTFVEDESESDSEKSESESDEEDSERDGNKRNRPSTLPRVAPKRSSRPSPLDDALRILSFA
jgi:hypothetical protein